MSNTPRIGNQYIEPGTSAEVPHNEALNRLDVLVAIKITDRDLTSPPAAANGDAYIVGPSSTGTWSGNDGKIAYYYGDPTVTEDFITPYEGMRVWISDEDNMAIYTGTYPTGSWRTVTGESILAMRHNAAGSTFTAAAAQLWDTELRKDGKYTHSTSSNTDQITLAEAGEYEVTVTATVEQTGSAGWTRSEIELTMNGSAITGTKSSGSTDLTNVAEVTLSLTTIVTSAAGGVLRLTAARVAGSGTVRLKANGARIVIRRV